MRQTRSTQLCLPLQRVSFWTANAWVGSRVQSNAYLYTNGDSATAGLGVAWARKRTLQPSPASHLPESLSSRSRWEPISLSTVIVQTSVRAPHSLSLGPFSSYTPVSPLLPSTCHAALNIQEYEQLLPSGQGRPKHPHTGTPAEAKGLLFRMKPVQSPWYNSFFS